MTPRILELLGERSRRVLELGFGGIHATPLRLSGHTVVVVEPDERVRAAAQQRAGDILATAPADAFDAVVAPAGADLTGIDAGLVLLVGQDGSVWRREPPSSG